MLLFYLIIIIILVSGLIFYFSFIKPKHDPFNKARELTKQNKIPEAITEYKKILYDKPDDINVHYIISELYLKLENYNEAIFHLNEILRIDKFNLEVQKPKVLRNLAQTYYLIDDVEKAFQIYFNILKINPEDPEAYYHISFIALGQEEFEIAQKYFEKLVKLRDDFESFFGAGICCYQNNKNTEALNYFKEALSMKPNSDIAALAISFTLRRTGKYAEAISYLNKLDERITEDAVNYLAKRLLSFLHFEANRNNEGLNLLIDLLAFLKEKNMPNEIKLTLYDLGFACVKNNALDQANKFWEELYQLDNDYEDIKEILNLLKKDLNKSTSGDGFESSIFDYVEDWIASAFSPDFLWNICGLKSNKIIDIKNIAVSAKIAKGKDIGREAADEILSEDRLTNFCDMSNESFRMLSNRLVLKLGYKVDEILHTYRESDGVDILTQSENKDNKERVLIWVRRWKGSKIGEITLRNFAQAINDIRAQKGILVTSAELTDAAQNSLAKLSKVNIIYPSELNELLKGLN
ncbi:MAG: tetratricopeptide repeat protein [Spirochaetota bacterium]